MSLLTHFKEHPLNDFFQLLRRYMLPRWKRFTLALTVGTGVGFLTSLHPLVFAPALNLFTKDTAGPAASLAELNLNNLGPTILGWLHLDPSSQIHIVGVVVLAYVCLALVIAVLTFLASTQSLILRLEVVTDIIQTMHAHLLGLSMQYANARTSGDFVSRISADARETAGGLDTLVTKILRYAAHILTSMFLLLKTDAMLTLAVGLLASVHFGVTKMFSGRLRRHSRRSAGLLGILSHTLFESVQGIRVIKTMAGERFMKKVLQRAIQNWRESTMKMRMISLLDTPIRFFIDAALVGGALVMTFLAMAHGRLTVEAAALFFILTRQMIDPVSQLSRTVLSINGAIGGASRIQEVLNAKATVEDGPDEAAALETSIRFEDVSFGYEKDTPVLSDIDLEIFKGQKVAVVGPSGGGKSTLADLLMRLYDPDRGRILYDGEDIRSFGQRGYRRQFGVVSQECLLFDGSIRENIVYGRPDNEAALQYALTVANAKTFIDAFSEGLDTMVGERGVRLSGGQRQRIALARAMYSRPSILVLDEATSALDAESELAVQEGIDRAIKDCTALIIAHRFSTVANADTVVVLNDGRLEAMGRHQDLVTQSPTYRKLYDIQVQFQAPGEGAHTE